MARDQITGVLLLDVLVFDLNVHHLTAIQLLEGKDLLAEASILALQGSQLLLVTVLQGLVIGKLILELGMLVVVGGLELADLLLEK